MVSRSLKLLRSCIRYSAVRWWLAAIIAESALGVGSPAAWPIDPKPLLETAERYADVTVGEVLQAWTARQDRVRTVRYAWSQDNERIDRFSTYRAAEVPKLEMSGDLLRDTLILDRDRMLVEMTRWHRQMKYEFAEFTHLDPNAVPFYRSSFNRALEQGFEAVDSYRQAPMRLRSVFDGQTRIDFYSAVDGEHGLGTVIATKEYGQGENAYLDDLTFRPILLALRPCSCLVPDLKHDLRVLNQNAQVDGRRCIVLEQNVTNSKPALKRTYWVDPARDSVVVRLIVTEAGLPREQFDIRYQSDAQCGWLPVWWNVMLFPSRQISSVQEYPGQPELFQHAAMKVVDVAVNEATAEIDFGETFPSGTYVFDRKRHQNYLVESNGEKRSITATELTEFAVDKENSAAVRRHSGRWRVVAAAAVAVAAGLVLGIRRWNLARKRAASQ